MAQHTFEHEMPGAVTLDVRVPAGRLRVHADAGIERARLLVRGAGTDLDRVGIDPTPGRVSLAATSPTGAAAGAVATGPGVVSRSVVAGTVVQQVSGVFLGDVVMCDAGVFLDGQAVTLHGAAGSNGEPLTVEAYLPAGSSLVFDTGDADVATSGLLQRIEGRTVAGDVDLDATDLVEVATTSGDVRIADFAGTATVTTVSGDVTVHATQDGNLTASSTSGDITVTAADQARPQVRARSVSGRVCLPGVPPETVRRRRS